MCKGVQCSKEISPEFESNAIVLNCDGDFVCSIKCKEDHDREIDYFCGTILTDDRRFAQWLGVPAIFL